MNNLKNSLEFHFHNGTVMGFDLSQMNSDNYADVAQAILDIFARRILLVNSGISKYTKKSNILPNRQFDLKMFVNGVLVNSHMNLKDLKPCFLKDKETLIDLLYVMFDDATDGTNKRLLSLTNVQQN